MADEEVYVYVKFRSMSDKELIVRVPDGVWNNKYDDTEQLKITKAMKLKGWLHNGIAKGEPESFVDVSEI